MTDQPQTTTPTNTNNDNTPRPIPDRNTWELLLDAYKEVKKDTDLKNDQAFYEAFASNPSGFAVPYEVRHTPNKGRGVFCTEDIGEGATICPDLGGGRFYTEAQWREFLSLIPPELAMDCVDWAGVDEDDDDDDSDDDSEDEHDDGGDHEDAVQFVFLDFSDTCLLNHGSLKQGKANCKGMESKDDGTWTWRMIATRDIAAGDELLCDYRLCGVGYDHNLPWFNKIHEEYYPGVPIDASELERFEAE